ncbi:TRAP transporter substrate-binding protein DctP [Bradyrhizobium sp. LHD-71]|uniref:TRAP transporter substrate-binding protein DctP n=1 Tax=Bradyrhizobium sp. LHD-71 TaxID=3072141 RepID=UPI00280F49BA|nr:TRAP transporter substrate-binding protein DctP [Bradyrhizobium sp. LHD-71]MDQ8729184.1 TRAP transporter substrate-binding protein DctP [Bradyrhizobium sp. LHD-71]
MRALALIAALTAGSALAVIGSASAQTVDGPKVTWKVGAWGKPRAASKGLDTLASYVKEQTGGKFTINVGYGSYGEPKELLDLVSVGALEATNMCSSYHPEKHPAYTALDLPFLPFPNADVQEKVHEKFHQHPYIRQELAKWKAFPFMSTLLPQYEFIGRSSPPPKTMSDWKGLRVRAIGGIGSAMAKIGAVPTSVDATEVYNLLERGTVDAASFPSTYAHGSYRTYEVGKWFTSNLAPGTQACPVVIGIEAWNKLPKQYQELLEKGKAIAYAEQKKAYVEADDKYLAEFKRKNLEFITYSKEQLAEFQNVAAKPVWDEWVAEKSKQGVPAEELLKLILDAAKAAPKS